MIPLTTLAMMPVMTPVMTPVKMATTIFPITIAMALAITSKKAIASIYTAGDGFGHMIVFQSHFN